MTASRKGASKAHKSGRSQRRAPPGLCTLCGATCTPQWRNDPDPAKDDLPDAAKKLCNSCGLKASAKFGHTRKPRGAGSRSTVSSSNASVSPRKRLSARKGASSTKDKIVLRQKTEQEEQAEKIVMAEILMDMRLYVPKPRPTVRVLSYTPSFFCRRGPKQTFLYPMPGIPSSLCYSPPAPRHRHKLSSLTLTHQKGKTSKPRKALFVEIHEGAATSIDKMDNSPASSASSLMPITPALSTSFPGPSTGGLLVEVDEEYDMNEEEETDGKVGAKY